MTSTPQRTARRHRATAFRTEATSERDARDAVGGPGRSGVPSSDAAFRVAMASLTGGVCVITTAAPDGSPVGLTVTTGFSVSMRPPIFGVSVDLTSRTLSPLLERGSFVANLLHGDASDVALTFASRAEDKFAAVPHELTTSGLPWLAGHSVRGVECAVERVIEAGDHVIVLGAVRQVHAPAIAVATGLAYADRRFHAVPLGRGGD